jgi:hypothetical protein
MFPILLNCCLCISIYISGHSGFSLRIILDSLLFLLHAEMVYFSTIHPNMLVFELEAMQDCYDLDTVCLNPTHGLIHSMSLLCQAVCEFAILTCQKLGGNGFFVRVWTMLFCIDLLLCEMLDLHEMDFMKATCMVYMKVGTVVQLEQWVICILTVSGLKIHQHNVKWFGSHNSPTQLFCTATPIIPETPRNSATG